MHRPSTTTPEKAESQGNDCQGNEKEHFQDYSSANHSSDISPAFFQFALGCGFARWVHLWFQLRF
jgi:hypothetical protein